MAGCRVGLMALEEATVVWVAEERDDREDKGDDGE